MKLRAASADTSIPFVGSNSSYQQRMVFALNMKQLVLPFQHTLRFLACSTLHRRQRSNVGGSRAHNLTSMVSFAPLLLCQESRLAGNEYDG